MKYIIGILLITLTLFSKGIELKKYKDYSIEYIDDKKEILLINKKNEISTLLERSTKNRFLRQKLIFILNINGKQYATENILIKDNVDYGIKFEKDLKLNIKKSYKNSLKRDINKDEINKIFLNLNKVNYIKIGEKIDKILIIDLNQNFDLSQIKNENNFAIIPFIFNDFDNKKEYKNLNLFNIKKIEDLNYDFLNKKNDNLDLKAMLIQNNYEISNIYFFKKSRFLKKK